MGADGRILIWHSAIIRGVWPDADSMLNKMCYHYKHKLNGIEYDHVYEATGFLLWSDIEEKFDLPQRQRAREFIEWLKREAVIWEVWT